jgi:hypothetical protein
MAAGVLGFALMPLLAFSESDDNLVVEPQQDRIYFHILGVPDEMDRLDRRDIVDPVVLAGIHRDILEKFMAERGFEKARNRRHYNHNEMDDFASKDEVYLGYVDVPGDCFRVYIIGVTIAQNDLVAEMMGTQVATVCR